MKKPQRSWHSVGAGKTLEKDFTGTVYRPLERMSRKEV